eukprot:TRINITY_DN989_c1_g2_i4.p1 TRINITY_DN989_c1_g2~~TRINITY_DN989_c1_g2_i4.p1  ORF type:complete len:135 (+),score=43.77 TRINITY_DN989_c1_g2_i4:3-407(+)
MSEECLQMIANHCPIGVKLENTNFFMDSDLQNLVNTEFFKDILKNQKIWSKSRHLGFRKQFRDEVFQVLLMWNRDEYDDDELDGFEWNMLPWEVIERVIRWMAFDWKTDQTESSQKRERDEENDEDDGIKKMKT